MARFQKPLSDGCPGEKWVLMEFIHRFDRAEVQGGSAAGLCPSPQPKQWHTYEREGR